MSHDDDEITEQHPSFGLVSFNRISSGGKRRLFGSAIRDHGQTIRLRITSNVKLHRSDSGDRYYAPNTPDIEVELSAAQFAELLTTMNVAMGVPCTVLYKEGKRIPDPPETASEAERVRGSFERRMAEAGKKLSAHRTAMVAKLEELKVSKKHWGALLDPVDKMIQEAGVNTPFWLEMFEEATEKIVVAAKAEVEAFTMSTLLRAGMKALSIDNGGPAPGSRRALSRPPGYDPTVEHGTSFEKDKP